MSMNKNHFPARPKTGFWFLLTALSFFSGWVSAETALWSDNFENNAAARWTAGSVWKIGSPTTGPAINSNGFRSYSGTNCATTGLAGNAPANADSRFICTNYLNGATNLFIPTSSPYARLRFWQWFDFVNAGGYVEVKTAGSTNWQAISSTNLSVGSTASTGSVWSRPSLNMSSFAGTNVQIAFHFFSGGNGYGNDLGWYLDDVALLTNQPVLNNPESFESNFADWSVDHGTWEIGKPTSGPDQAHSGTNCAGTVLGGDYGWNVDSRLISPPFLVPTSGNQTLHFWQWYQLVNALGFVEIRTNSTWQTISTTNISVGSSGVSSGGWKTNAAINLSAYAGQTAQIAFHFQSGSSGYGTAPGWYLDDISLSASPTLIVPTNVISASVGTPLVLTNEATLIPGGTPTFTFNPGAPANAALNATNGIFTWTPASTQTGTNIISIIVTDPNGLAATNSFTVQVSAATSPTILLTVPANQNIYADQTLNAVVSATNTSSASATFTYSLASAPANVSLNPATGILNWTPTSAQAGTSTIFVTATQTNNPPPVTNSFSVQVSLPPSPVANATISPNGFQFGFTNIAGVNWEIEVSTDLLNWTTLTNTTVSASNVFQISDPILNSQRFYRAVLP